MPWERVSCFTIMQIVMTTCAEFVLDMCNGGKTTLTTTNSITVIIIGRSGFNLWFWQYSVFTLCRLVRIILFLFSSLTSLLFNLEWCCLSLMYLCSFTSLLLVLITISHSHRVHGGVDKPTNREHTRKQVGRYCGRCLLCKELCLLCLQLIYITTCTWLMQIIATAARGTHGNIRFVW